VIHQCCKNLLEIIGARLWIFLRLIPLRLFQSKMKSRYTPPASTLHQEKVNYAFSDTLSISDEARMKIRNETIKSGMTQLEESMKKDPSLAKNMARNSAYVRDRS